MKPCLTFLRAAECLARHIRQMTEDALDALWPDPCGSHAYPTAFGVAATGGSHKMRPYVGTALTRIFHTA